MKFKVLARHKWVAGAIITESIGHKQQMRRFTATIRGFRNWKIYQGKSSPAASAFVIVKVKEIRDRIDAGDELVFNEPNLFAVAESITV